MIRMAVLLTTLKYFEIRNCDTVKDLKIDKNMLIMIRIATLIMIRIVVLFNLKMITQKSNVL